MILLGFKKCRAEGAKATVQVNILAPRYCAHGVPGTSELLLPSPFLLSEYSKPQCVFA